MTETPNLANADSADYWAGVAQGRLLFQTCRSCGAVQFPPRHHCASCWEADLEWIESAGQGIVESHTVVRRAPLPAFRDKVPYVIAAVRMAEGPRMIGGLVGDKAEDARIGDAVTVTFETAAGGEVLPYFRLDADAG